jgi:hypothetical protein
MRGRIAISATSAVAEANDDGARGRGDADRKAVDDNLVDAECLRHATKSDDADCNVSAL